MSNFFLEIVVLLLTGAVLAVLGYHLKMINKLWQEIQFSHDRHEVSDRIVGIMIKTPFSSDRIAKGHDPFPKIH